MKLTKKEIDQIINDQIEVDCDTDEEANIGWAIYLEENISYPFSAEYFLKKKSGKKEWQQVTVVRNKTSESSFRGGDYYVEIEINEIIIPAKIDALRNIDADEETLKTLYIWKNR